MRVIYKELSVT